MDTRPKLLFVDDEPSIRALMPAILKQRGFDVSVAATVSEALTFIANQTFEVLLSDLNIGEPGDGFTVVSAMRRTQPDASTFILTGYPAFESALEAIRQQVDDYFVKPANPDTLVKRIMERLNAPPTARVGLEVKRLPEILDQHKLEIFARWIQEARNDARLRAASSVEKLSDRVPGVIDEVIDAASRPPFSQQPLPEARHHGLTRSQQGWSIADLIREAHILQTVLSQVVQENLLSADTSFVVTDIMRIGEAVHAFLEESLQAFSEAEERGAQSKDSTTSSRSVLLLSRDSELSLLREYVLRKEGYQVARATSREQALRLLQTHFDALVVSYTLSDDSLREYVELFRIANPGGSVIAVLKESWQDLKIELEGYVNANDGPEPLLRALSAALARKQIRIVK